MKFMAGPVKQFNREEALERAMALFWANGYEATSIQELVETMGVNRASLYDTFGNKQSIYNQALDKYCNIAQLQIEKIANSQPPDANASAIAILKNILIELLVSDSSMKQAGCFINNTAVELGPHDAALAEKVNVFWQLIENNFKSLLDKAVSQNEIPRDTNTQEMASFVNTVMQGMAVRNKVGSTPGQALASIEYVVQLIQS